MSYNGWSNYETWNMALWIDNEEGAYRYSRDLARDSSDAWELAETLKQWQEDEMPDLPASVWSDLLRAAFGDIDWQEIAQNYMEEVRDEA